VIALRAVEPREDALPKAGLIAVEDAESGKRRFVETRSKRVRDAYAKAAAQRRAVFRGWCGATGIAGYDLPTELDPIGPLTRIFNDVGARRGRR